MAKRKRYVVIARAYNAKGKILAVARNSYTKTHTLQAHYAKKVGRESAIFLHAEIAALLKAREPVSKMEILRMTVDGKPALAKPCDACSLALQEFGVKEIIHTIN